MTLVVYTDRVSYRGPDRLDVTRSSAGPDGLPFAPSWGILTPILRLRQHDMHREFERAWPGYVENYTDEMRVSYRDDRPSWNALLARRTVTLVCYCVDPAHCHRTLLAGILGKLGAEVKGERAL
jgi:uncharacterized protein YeaO (DUF488 family)